MRKRAFMLVKGLVILILAALVFSYAMFQGGFVSWFLFYSVLVILCLSLSTLFVPVRSMAMKRMIKNNGTIFTNDDLEVVIEFEQRFFHPFCYLKIVDIVPDSLQDRILNGSGALYFLTFKRKESFTYTIKEIPRGEYCFSKVEVEIGDLFGFFERKKIFTLKQQLVVFPKYRDLRDFQVGSVGGTEKRHSFVEAIEKDVSIAGIRPYVPGDKQTLIDWKHTARQNELMSKQFSETEQSTSLLLFNPVIELKPKATFEKQVELAASFVYYYYSNKRSLAFVSLANEMEAIEKTNEIAGFQTMYRLLATTTPNHKSFVPPNSISTQEKCSWIVVSSILSNAFADWLLEQRAYVETIIVCWIYDKPTNAEKQNRLLLREKNIRVYTFTNDYFQQK